jgi:hypothetical protein
MVLFESKFTVNESEEAEMISYVPKVIVSNQTYHFRTKLINRQNSSLVFTGDLLVQVEEKLLMEIIVQ